MRQYSAAKVQQKNDIHKSVCHFLRFFISVRRRQDGSYFVKTITIPNKARPLFSSPIAHYPKELVLVPVYPYLLSGIL